MTVLRSLALVKASTEEKRERVKSPYRKRESDKPDQAEAAPVEALRATHVRREVKTALELALASMGPSEMVDRLALAAGMLEALAEFPTDAAPVVATAPRALAIASEALSAWHSWETRPGRKALG